ncbi:hypothetical protein EVAR_22809_1 [Eumeta japonica]|uniref:Uncharacterized protein n=1 Tax=Eumeta variegata TaxID=151549 RepID=A0A4C1VFE7_EUMVA|nr:hypothetical protein EVAR_22809_1 [Eumeta japonica]
MKIARRPRKPAAASSTARVCGNLSTARVSGNLCPGGSSPPVAAAGRLRRQSTIVSSVSRHLRVYRQLPRRGVPFRTDPIKKFDLRLPLDALPAFYFARRRT